MSFPEDISLRAHACGGCCKSQPPTRLSRCMRQASNQHRVSCRAGVFVRSYFEQFLGFMFQILGFMLQCHVKAVRLTVHMYRTNVCTGHYCKTNGSTVSSIYQHPIYCLFQHAAPLRRAYWTLLWYTKLLCQWSCLLTLNGLLGILICKNKSYPAMSHTKETSDMLLPPELLCSICQECR